MDRRNFIFSGITSLTTAEALGGFSGAQATGNRGVDADRPRNAAVGVSQFGATADGLQKAIDSGAYEVVIDVDTVVSTDVTLRSGQTLRCAGGKIIVPRGASFRNAVLYSNGGAEITIVGLKLDATAHAKGVPGVKLVNVNDTGILGGILRRANILIESFDPQAFRSIALADLKIDMGGYASTALYLSGVRGVTARRLECLGGREGVGVYNGARGISLSEITSHDHIQDGFLINSGQEISHDRCTSYDNGQSGFATQRQVSGDDSRIAVWLNCIARSNKFDGFDIRGANKAPWGTDTVFMLIGCFAQDNVRCGFYVVNAEGTTLDSCIGMLNRQNNFFIDHSDRVTASSLRSISGASEVDFGPNKAGILVYNSNSVHLSLPVSGNQQEINQDFGISFTGSSEGGRVFGGDLRNNRSGAFVLGRNAIIGCIINDNKEVSFREVSEFGIYQEEGIRPPRHDRRAGSRFLHLDEIKPQLYISKGQGKWQNIEQI